MNEHPEFQPPWVDVRIAPLEITVGELRRDLPSLVFINLHPFAAGPEIQLTFGSPYGGVPLTTDAIEQVVVNSGLGPVFAIRKRST